LVLKYRTQLKDLFGEKNNDVYYVMRKILVGYDGSQGAEYALDKALAISDPGGDILLLAVVPGYSEKSFLDKDAYARAKIKAKKIISDKIEELRTRFDDISFKGIIKKGDAADQIINSANVLSCDLIVLGCRGTSEISTYLLGSVADKVVHHAHKPVMVVR